MNAQEDLGRCEDWVRQAVSAGAAQAEVYWEEGASLDVDLERDAIGATGLARQRGGAVRLVADGRVGFAYFTEPSAFDQAVEQALRNCRRSPDRGYRLPPGKRVPEPRPRWDDGVALLEVDDATQRALELVRGAKDVLPDCNVAGGGVSLGWDTQAIASSEGVAAADRSTHVGTYISLVLGEAGQAVSHWDGQTRHGFEADPTELAARTARVLADLRGPGEAGASGRHDVVFRPEAVAELLLGFVGSAAAGDDAMRGKTVWSGSLGEKVGHEGLRVVDDPTHPEAIGATAMDGEGLACRRLPILEDGVLRTFLFDSWDAHEHGHRTTHSAVRGSFKSRPTTGSHHLVLEHERTLPFDRLVGDVDEGYLVGSVLGAHTANATTGDFSITAPNVWRIQGGEVTGTCREVALGGNLPELLGRLDAVGDAPRRMDGARVPAVRMRDLAVSS